VARKINELDHLIHKKSVVEFMVINEWPKKEVILAVPVFDASNTSILTKGFQA
jgi:hypothetical protein